MDVRLNGGHSVRSILMFYDYFISTCKSTTKFQILQISSTKNIANTNYMTS